MRVAVNFLGPFGLACEAAGAELWASNWYKSLCRLRLADKLAGGRAYPSYWSYRAATDIHLDKDFDRLNKAGIVNQIADRTAASQGLLTAAASSVSAASVPAWRYRQSNVSAAIEHYLLSSINAEQLHNSKNDNIRDFVEQWLRQALAYSRQITSVLDNGLQTRIEHIQAWHDAFLGYREFHNV